MDPVIVEVRGGTVYVPVTVEVRVGTEDEDTIIVEVRVGT